MIKELVIVVLGVSLLISINKEMPIEEKKIIIEEPKEEEKKNNLYKFASVGVAGIIIGAGGVLATKKIKDKFNGEEARYHYLDSDLED